MNTKRFLLLLGTRLFPGSFFVVAAAVGRWVGGFGGMVRAIRTRQTNLKQQIKLNLISFDAVQ